ncbi:hypothetical protein AB0L40_26035, partial [Patulibacter sp. NPDC049589]
MDRERFQFDRQVRQMAGVLTVVDDQPRPGGVTLRVVAGHGDRIRSAALAIAPPGLELYVLEDDLVTTVPELPAPDPGAWSAGGPRGDDVGVAPGRGAPPGGGAVVFRPPPPPP